MRAKDLPQNREAATRRSYLALLEARMWAVEAQAPKLAARIRLAISSAKGAQRNAVARLSRHERSKA